MEIDYPIYHTDYSHKNADERSAEERAIDDWIPVTCSRTAKWWHSTVHLLTVIIGAGVLGLPYAMAEMGWGPGSVFMVVSWIMTLYSSGQLVDMHEILPGKRFDRYHELGQFAFGKKLGLWIVLPLQLIGVIGACVVYMVTAGRCLQKFHDLVCEDCADIKLTYFIMIFASVQFIISQFPSFNSIVRISFAAAVLSLSYSTIAWVASINKGVQPNVQYGYKLKTAAGTVLDSFSSMGSVVFAYFGHGLVLEIQASMPSTPEKPSKGPMWKAVVVAYIIVALCYFPVAFIGYGMLGNEVDENILITLGGPKWLIALANMLLVVHLIGGYQVYAMPVFDGIETVLVKRLQFRATWYLRLISRQIYVAFTMLIAISFPFFGGILGFIGGFCLVPTAYNFPSVIWLAFHKPRRYCLSWFGNWACIIFGAVLTVVGSIGGLRQIVLHAKEYKFFS